MAFLDNIFNPSNYSDTISRYLGYPQPQLGASSAGFPDSYGLYGGVNYPIYGKPQDETTTLPAQTVQPQQAPQQQAAPQPAQYGPLDALYNFSDQLRQKRGLITALAGAVTGHPANTAEEPTKNALIQAGAPPEVADAAAKNPAILAAVAPRYLGEAFKIVPYGGTAINNKGDVLFKNDAGGEFTLDQPTLEAMAHQARQGDTTVFQNLGRGIQGAQNIVMLRKEIARQNAVEGTSGEEQAAKNAEFFGSKAGQRAIGTRTANIELAANELKNVIPVVLDASKAVNRTNYPDLNKVILAYQEKTGDPNVVKFGQGINTLINLYARAINPSGIPTVYDKSQAHDILYKAWSSGQFEGAVSMMQKEVDAALASPGLVKQQMRDRILGREPTAAPATPSASGIVDYKDFFGTK